MFCDKDLHRGITMNSGLVVGSLWPFSCLVLNGVQGITVCINDRQIHPLGIYIDELWY
jgi:hypothetical protein